MNNLDKKDKNISPKVAPSVYAVMEQMQRNGLTRRNLISIIHDDIGRRKINKTDIERTLDALEKIEERFIRAQKRLPKEQPR